MALHMLKLCVGIETVADLREFRDLFKTKEGVAYHRHITRYTPKRADEILDGGSIYWIIKGFVQVRQRIIGFEKIETSTGIKTSIMMEPTLIETQSQPRRPHQGWRYLKAEDAPEDTLNAARDEKQDMPEEMAAELRGLGLI